MGPCDSDRKEAGQLGGLPQPPRDGRHPSLCFSMIQRLLGASGWGFHWLFQTRLEGGEKKKERKRSNFSPPQLPWVCAANCHCETSIVRLSLPRSSRGSARGQGLH